jgi:hypothetical protein
MLSDKFIAFLICVNPSSLVFVVDLLYGYIGCFIKWSLKYNHKTRFKETVPE